MNDFTLQDWGLVAGITYCLVFTAFSHARSIMDALVGKLLKHGNLHKEVNDLLFKIGRPPKGHSETTQISGEDFLIVVKQWRKEDENPESP